MHSRTTAVVCGLAALSAVAVAQITIDHNEVPSAVGDTIWHKYNDGVVSVDVGMPGGPHTWTFDTAHPGRVGYAAIVDKAGTPFADDFPDADLCYREEADSMDLYFYHRLIPTEYRMYGQGMVGPGTSFVQVYDPTCLTLPMPYTMGTTWVSEFAWSDSGSDTIVMVVATRAECRIDGWGTAVTPAGSFPCLRENSVRRIITGMYIHGVPVWADTSWDRAYYWFAEQVGHVANAKSLADDTSANFTQSDCYTILTGTNVGAIAEEAQGPRMQSPLATVARDVLFLPLPADGGRLTATLFDATGRQVADFTPGPNPVAHLSPGVYILRLDEDGTAGTAKLILQD